MLNFYFKNSLIGLAALGIGHTPLFAQQPEATESACLDIALAYAAPQVRGDGTALRPTVRRDMTDRNFMSSSTQPG